MSGPLRIAGFLVVLGAVFAAALGVGYAVGPVAEPAPDDMAGHAAAGDDAHAAAGHAPAMDEEIPGGLMVAQGGYRFHLLTPEAEPGRDVPILFRIDGSDGEPIRDYDVEHGKRLHLIAVRRDFSGFQHVHPRLGHDGTWRTVLDLTPGEWRLFADFKPTGGDGMVLGADLTLRGAYHPAGAPAPTRTVGVDGYTVGLAGELTAGADSTLTLTVSRNGRPVTDLQPYLEAYGHLVALREGDLAYLYVHPEGAPGDGSTQPGPDIVFGAAVPSVGRYRLFLDFKHEGVVRTAEFAMTAQAGDGGEGSDDHAH
jgi:hypothetical protein